MAAPQVVVIYDSSDEESPTSAGKRQRRETEPPARVVPNTSLSLEQRARIQRNRALALERRGARESMVEVSSAPTPLPPPLPPFPSSLTSGAPRGGPRQRSEAGAENHFPLASCAQAPTSCAFAALMENKAARQRRQDGPFRPPCVEPEYCPMDDGGVRARELLERDGVVVFRGVLSEADIAKVRS